MVISNSILIGVSLEAQSIHRDNFTGVLERRKSGGMPSMYLYVTSSLEECYESDVVFSLSCKRQVKRELNDLW